MNTIQMSIYVLGVLIALALVFDFMNGFHDAANAIAGTVPEVVLDRPCGEGDTDEAVDLGDSAEHRIRRREERRKGRAPRGRRAS